MSENQNYKINFHLINNIKKYTTVVKSLIMRDIKSRFLGSAWGYALSLGWPLSHIAVLLFIHSLFGRVQPYGDSAAVWYSTGIVPFMAFSYTMRFIVLGLIQNSPLLSFPIVKVTDIIFARVVVEIMSVFIVFIIISIVMNLFGFSFIPNDPLRAFYSIIMSICLGVSFGVIFAGPARISPGWNIVSVLFVMVLWMSSGVFFVPFFLPGVFLYIYYMNPLAHIISLFRSAYFDGFAIEYISYNYVLCWCLFSFAFAFIMERLLRGRLLQG